MCSQYSGCGLTSHLLYDFCWRLGWELKLNSSKVSTIMRDLVPPDDQMEEYCHIWCCEFVCVLYNLCVMYVYICICVCECVFYDHIHLVSTCGFVFLSVVCWLLNQFLVLCVCVWVWWSYNVTLIYNILIALFVSISKVMGVYVCM